MRRLASSAIALALAITLCVLARSASADDDRDAAIEACIHREVPPAYTYPFALNVFADAKTVLSQCSDTWKVCWPRVKAVFPDTMALGRKIAEIGRVASTHSCSIDDLNDQTLKQLSTYCGNNKDDCLPFIESAEVVLDAGNRTDFCNWNAGFEANRREICTGEVEAEEEAKAEAEEKEKSEAEEAAEAEAEAQAREDKREEDAQEADDEEAARVEAEAQRHRDLAAKYEEEKRTADASNDQLVNDVNSNLAAASQIAGGNQPHGPSTHLHVELGTAAMVSPVYNDTDGLDVSTPYSSGTTALALGFHMQAAFEPWHSPTWSLGLFGQGDMGGYALPGGSSYIVDFAAGLSGSIGRQAKNSLVWRAALGWRSAAASGNSGGGIVDAYSSGSGSTKLTRLSVGWRHCVGTFYPDKRFCEMAVQFDLGTDLALGVTPIIVGASMRMSGMITLGLQGSLGYPRIGTPSYGGQGDTSGTPYSDPGGFMMGLTLGYNYDHYGAPRRPKARRAATTSAVAESSGRGESSTTGEASATGETAAMAVEIVEDGQGAVTRRDPPATSSRRLAAEVGVLLSGDDLGVHAGGAYRLRPYLELTAGVRWVDDGTNYRDLAVGARYVHALWPRLAVHLGGELLYSSFSVNASGGSFNSRQGGLSAGVGLTIPILRDRLDAGVDGTYLRPFGDAFRRGDQLLVCGSLIAHF